MVRPEPGPDHDFWNTAHPLWESWYAAAWAESGVLSGAPDAVSRLHYARELCRTNKIALALVDRAAALHDGRIDDLDPIIGRLTTLGCRYQADRTRVLAAHSSGADHGVPGGPPMAASTISVDPTETKDR
jgi:hypothetical protein